MFETEWGKKKEGTKIFRKSHRKSMQFLMFFFDWMLIMFLIINQSKSDILMTSQSHDSVEQFWMSEFFFEKFPTKILDIIKNKVLRRKLSNIFIYSATTSKIGTKETRLLVPFCKLSNKIRCSVYGDKRMYNKDTKKFSINMGILNLSAAGFTELN